MKKILAALLIGVSTLAANAKADVSRIDPPMWWTGMNNTSLQLMVSGNDIRDAVPEINYDGVTIDSVARLDSPNYQLIYLNIAEGTKPGSFDITFKDGKKNIKKKYELLSRDKAGTDYNGFTSEDALYLIMPDRFADGNEQNNTCKELKFNPNIDRNDPNARHGGDIAGIKAKIPYLKELGVTAIWLTPVLENDMPGGSYHGYATTDYYRVDPRFGSNEEYKELIAECHKAGIKVVMDMIFNHCGIAHPWLADTPSKDWLNSPVDVKQLGEGMLGKQPMPKEFNNTNFKLTPNHDPYTSNYDYDKTVNGWFVPAMPDLNQRNTHLMTYLIQNSIWWIEYAKINGIRMDTYPYADMAGMAKWNVAVDKEYPNFNIVGESWFEDVASIAFMQKDNKINPINTELKTVMDFPVMISSRKTFNDQTIDWKDGLHNLYNRLSLDFLFANPNNILMFYDNHDSDRFLLEMPKTLDNWKQAQTFLLTARGIPQIYYGTEILMNGSKEKSDGFVRLDMPGGFPGDKANEFVAEGRTDMQNDAFNFISKILKWRKDNKAISEGTTKHFYPSNRLYVYERKSADRRVIVIMNGTDNELTDIDMSRYAEIFKPGDTFKDIVTDKTITITDKMTFPKRATLILE